MTETLSPAALLHSSEEGGGLASVFETASREAFAPILGVAASRLARRQAPHFDVSTWKGTSGGLLRVDRLLLSEVYKNATSVFEFGLGESTSLADHMQVPRYSGIDSDANYVRDCAQKVSSDYRFYLADIGATAVWGFPTDRHLAKQAYDYQVAPLAAEPAPFDVYLVDGRWRVPLVMLSFLHASARGALPQDTRVLLHDCVHLDRTPKEHHHKLRANYQAVNELLSLENHSGGLLCVYKRKPGTTDDDLLRLW